MKIPGIEVAHIDVQLIPGIQRIQNAQSGFHTDPADWEIVIGRPVDPEDQLKEIFGVDQLDIKDPDLGKKEVK